MAHAVRRSAQIGEIEIDRIPDLPLSGPGEAGARRVAVASRHARCLVGHRPPGEDQDQRGRQHGGDRAQDHVKPANPAQRSDVLGRRDGPDQQQREDR